MRQPQLLDMSDAGFNVEHMSKMIQIRNVPDEMHRTLKEAAAREGMSLSDYIKRELVGVGSRSNLERIEARARNRERAKWSPQDIVDIIREHRGE
jgi:plasmid stability protein